MKNAVIMIRENFLGLQVEQNHKTGMINATKFLAQYNATNVANSLTVVNQDTQDKRDVSLSSDNHVTNEIVANQDVTLLCDIRTTKDMRHFKRLEGLDEYMSEVALINNCNVKDLMMTRRGKYAGTWIHPLMFVKMCRWLSPKFEAHADKIIHDHLLQLRDQSGDEYKSMCKALSDNDLINDQWDYAKVAQAIARGILGTGKTVVGSWDTATAKQLDARRSLETYIATAVNDGLIDSLSQVIKIIKKRGETT